MASNAEHPFMYLVIHLFFSFSFSFFFFFLFWEMHVQCFHFKTTLFDFFYCASFNPLSPPPHAVGGIQDLTPARQVLYNWTPPSTPHLSTFFPFVSYAYGFYLLSMLMVYFLVVFSYFEALYVGLRLILSTGCKIGSTFILLHTSAQFSPPHLWKRMSFLQCMFLVLLLTISCLHMHGFISGLSILFHWFADWLSSQCCPILVTIALQNVFRSGIMMPPTLYNHNFSGHKIYQ